MDGCGPCYPRLVGCPGERSLAELVRGRTPDEDKDQLLAHLEACDVCRAAVAEGVRRRDSTGAEAASTVVVSVTDPGSRSAAAAPDPFDSGDADRRYEIIEEVGQGGMGIVYAAQDRVLGRRVALKLLRLDVGGRENETMARARMLKEAQALARLNHPNVVTVHDAGVLPSGAVFVAMELVTGTTLRRWLETDRDWRVTIATFVAAGRGLQAAHAKGIVHRDFKLENVLIDVSGHVLVTDFGLARAFGEPGEDERASAARLTVRGAATDLSITRSGWVMGTPGYMAPEQHTGAPNDARTDQFAFCVALCEALYGKRPFEGSSPEVLANNVVAGHITQPSPKPGGPPLRVFEILRKGLQPAVEERYSTMEELLERLQEVMAPPRWPRWLVGTVVLGAAAGLAWSALDRRTPCRDLDVPAIRVWNDEVETRIGAAFAEIGPAGHEAWMRVEPELDAWVRAWSAARADACEATRVRGEQSDRLLELRMRCLDDRLHSLETYLEILGAADDVIVAHAVVSARSLVAVEDCSDVDRLESAVPIPEQGELAEAVEALRGELRRVRATSDTGRYEDALAMAKIAVERAEGLGFEPLVAEAKVELGLLLATDAQSEPAEDALDEAMTRALACGHDRVLARAAVGLLQVVAHQPERDGEATRVAALADAALQRSGNPLELRSRWLQAQGQRAKEAARWEEAETHLRALLELHRAEPAMGTGLVLGLNEMGDLRRRRGEHEEAVALFEEALGGRRELLGHHHPDVARDLNNLALALEGMGRADEALARLEEALTALRTGYSGEHPDVARVHNNVGMVLSSMGRLDEAIEHLHEALRIKRERLGEGAPALGSTLANLAVLELRRGALTDATERFEEALDAYIRGVGEDHPIVVRIRGSLALLWLARGDEDRALAEIETALATKAGTDPTESDARALAWAQVELMLATDQPREAVALAKQLRTDEQAGSEPSADATIGRALVAAGELGEARALLEAEVIASPEPTEQDTTNWVRTQLAWSAIAPDRCAVLRSLPAVLDRAILLTPREKTDIAGGLSACEVAR